MPKVEDACRQFLSSRRSIMLSTVSPDGELETSALPCVWLNPQELVIWVSELAPHTRNLLAMTRSAEAENAASKNSTGRVSGLLVADEQATPQLFARERISLQLAVESLQSEARAEAITRLREAFGEVMDVLAGLPDFHAFKLRVVGGRYVRGFGAAYAFENSPCEALKGINNA
ncbi:HugZ family protein [Thiomicrorhabdus cannonii]|uniref:HugZ family pyridoxamine 5'-phosphate oxidase n=1 Tax=Thiomicrorhabdus cannonii TaxID=2748011 RepID=UPI0015BA0F87|nr:pyridoxamine 5'-phosphate oxidase family protein [Thiomicrorhabdus cannonii]